MSLRDKIDKALLIGGLAATVALFPLAVKEREDPSRGNLAQNEVMVVSICFAYGVVRAAYKEGYTGSTVPSP